ncbi:hypothetical protein L0F63_001484 [Massospora cicadina]|nr:hypothetical protein L0F63_001484 [Massospora cicadina]
MKFSVKSEHDTFELDTEELPLELPTLYGILGDKPLVSQSYLTLAEVYSERGQVATSVALLDRGTELASEIPSQSLSDGGLGDLVQTLIPKILQTHFTEIQDALAKAVALAKQLSPLHIDLPIIKGYWQFYYRDYHRAALYFTKALAREPKKASATLGLALASYYKGNYDLALTKFLVFALLSDKAGLERSGVALFDYRMGIALCQIELGRDEAALRVLEGIIKQSPEKADAYALMGYIRLKQFKYGANRAPEYRKLAYKEATTICTRALVAHPHHPTLALILAEVHFYARSYEKVVCGEWGLIALQAYEYAQVAYERASPSAKPLRGEACYIGAKVKYLLGEDAEASQLLDQALRLTETHEPSLVLQALLFFKEGDTERALKKLEGIIAQGRFTVKPQLFSSDIQVNLLYMIMYARLNKADNCKDYLLSDEEFARHIAQVKCQLSGAAPASRHSIFVALVEVAKAYERRDGWLGAELSYKDALSAYADANPTREDYANLARCANNAGAARLMHDSTCKLADEFFIGALGYADKADPSLGALLEITIKYNVALNYEKHGLIAEAKTIFEELRNKYPSYFNATLKLGLLAQAEKDFNRAAKLFNEVIDCTNDLSTPHLRQFAIDGYILLGSLQQELRQLKAARTSFKTVLSKYDGDDFYALLAVGHNYYLVARTEDNPDLKAKCYHDAALYFNKAHKAHPNNPYPVAGIGCLLAAQGHFETARKVFKEIGTSIETTTVLNNHAHCCFRLGMLKDAADLYQQVLEECPETIEFAILQCHARALYALGIQTNSLKHIEHSILQLQKAKKQNPREMTLLFDEGLALQKFCQLVCEKDPDECGTYRVERSLKFLEEAKRNFEHLKTLPREAQCGFNTHTLQNRIGFCKTIRSTLVQRLEVTRAIESAKPKKVIETFGMDVTSSFDAYGILDCLPALKKEPSQASHPAGPAQVRAPLPSDQPPNPPSKPLSAEDQPKPSIKRRSEPSSSPDHSPKPARKLSGRADDEYDPDEVVARSPKRYRSS